MKDAVILLLIFVTACGNKKEDETPSKSFDSQYHWVRPVMSGGNTTAYFSYTNSLDVTDTLQSIESDVASEVQIHESYRTEDGMMGMREIEEIILKAGEILRLEPGGFHMMLIDLHDDIRPEDSVSIILNWKIAGRDTLRLAAEQN